MKSQPFANTPMKKNNNQTSKQKTIEISEENAIQVLSSKFNIKR